MKITIERGELMRALGHVTSVVERRNTIPILSNVLLRAESSSLHLRATDLEREVSEAVPADVQKPGAITVPAHLLNDIVRKLPSGSEVELALESDRLAIRAGRSRFALQTIAAEDFPDLGGGKFPHAFEVPAADLKSLIEKTRFAISTEETRYYLNGIYLHTAERDGKPSLRAVATDGHRLAQLDVDLPRGAEGMAGVIVPRKTVHELHRLIEASDAPLNVGVSDSKVRFEIGPVTLTSKLIDGSFPDYQRVIPQSNNKEMQVSAVEFAASVERVSTIASERGGPVKLSIAPGKITISASNPDGGSATDEIATDYEASAVEIGFSARYLLDVVGLIDGEIMRLLLDTPGAPALVRDDGDDRALYVLMPMRV